MGDYRFYLLNGDGGVGSRREHACKDDLDALDLAREFCRDHAVDVWTGIRLVAHLKPGDLAHSPRDLHPG